MEFKMKSENKKPNLYLSKSLFIKGLQCHKHLWLEKYQPEQILGVDREVVPFVYLFNQIPLLRQDKDIFQAP